MKNHYFFSQTKMQTVELLPAVAVTGHGTFFAGKGGQGISKWGILRWLAVLLLLMSFSMGVNAQKIEEYHTFLSQMKSSDDTTLVAEGDHLKSLVTELYTITYLNLDQPKKYGEGDPVVVSFDARSVNMLYDNNNTFTKVEMLKLKISTPQELKQTIDMDRLVNFEHLKYLLIVFEYDTCGEKSTVCLPSWVDEIVDGDLSSLTVLYMLSIPQ